MDYDANFLLVLWIILAIKRRSGEALGGSWGGMERKNSDGNGQKSKKSKSNGKKCSDRSRSGIKEKELLSLRESRRGTLRLRGFEAWRLSISLIVKATWAFEKKAMMKGG